MEAVDQALLEWAHARVHPGEIDRYLGADGGDFIDDTGIRGTLAQAQAPDDGRLQWLLEKSLSIRDLSPSEAAELMAVTEPRQRQRMAEAAWAVKRKVYGTCVAAFAPLHLGNACVNSCAYCGFKTCRPDEHRRVLSEAEIQAAVEVLAGQLGHRQLLAVVGEHPSTDAKYICDSLAAIQAAQARQGRGFAQVRCVGLNAPPMCIADLRAVQAAGLGSYHVHQATYDRAAFQAAHQSGPKSDYRWRLYAMHRAMDAGIGQVGLGILAGLADWRFEGLALLAHAQALEARYGSGPATIQLQRLEPGNPAADPDNPVDEDSFLRLLTVLRLALPYVGLIVGSSEGHGLRARALALGVTLTDAAPAIAVGAYHEGGFIDAQSCRQFALGDPEPLQGLVGDLGSSGSLTSFCSPGMHCDRRGTDFMDALRSGAMAKACRMNAVLSFKEWIEDFADLGAQAAGERLLDMEVAELGREFPDCRGTLSDHLGRIGRGERGLAY
jgi:2-iminoacetate synthase